jgi:hypothetical protein
VAILTNWVRGVNRSGAWRPQVVSARPNVWHEGHLKGVARKLCLSIDGMDSHRRCGAKYESLLFIDVAISVINLREELEMNASTVAVDLAKSVFQLAVADQGRRVMETHRLTRAQFARWFDH